MMQHIRRYLGWFLIVAVLAIPLATTGCFARYRYRDYDRHRRHDRTDYQYRAERYDRHR